MKRLGWLMAGWLMAGVALAGDPVVLDPGMTAPDFTAKTAESKTITLSSFRGKIVVLEWANYDCPFSHMQYASGAMPNMQSAYTGRGVVWLTVMSSAPGKEGYYDGAALREQNQKYRNHATYVIADGSGAVGKAMGAKTTPHIIVLDAKGVVRYNGAINSIPSTDSSTLGDAIPYAAEAINALMQGRTPDPAQNAPYGCHIKYAD